jgi:hypothetical protein
MTDMHQIGYIFPWNPFRVQSVINIFTYFNSAAQAPQSYKVKHMSTLAPPMHFDLPFLTHQISISRAVLGGIDKEADTQHGVLKLFHQVHDMLVSVPP